MDEHEHEPVPGLPQSLPSGERMLWQGRPDWAVLARRAYHVRTVAIYFGVLVLFSAGAALGDGASAAQAAAAGLVPAGLGVAAVGILALLAWLSARSTLYTVTDRRIVLRFGVALPVSMNLPFASVASAAARVHADGTADVPLSVSADQRVSYVLLWPHVRPWRMRSPEPMLRAVPDGARVAGLLGGALAAHAEARSASAEADAPSAPQRPSAQPAPAAPAAAAAREAHGHAGLAGALGSARA
jgi:hypothetical protein